VKDFVSLREIDVPGLLAMLGFAETAERSGELDMAGWHCGTAGCLVGTFCHANPNDRLQLVQPSWSRDLHPRLVDTDKAFGEESIAARFGLNLSEARFLFTCEHLLIWKRTSGQRYEAECFNVGEASPAHALSPLAAISRLRKFLYYKMRKSELLEDYQAARLCDSVVAFSALRDRCRSIP